MSEADNLLQALTAMNRTLFIAMEETLDKDKLRRILNTLYGNTSTLFIHFITNPAKGFTVEELKELTGLKESSVYRGLEKLGDVGLIQHAGSVRVVRKTKWGKDSGGAPASLYKLRNGV